MTSMRMMSAALAAVLVTGACSREQTPSEAKKELLSSYVATPTPAPDVDNSVAPHMPAEVGVKEAANPRGPEGKLGTPSHRSASPPKASSGAVQGHGLLSALGSGKGDAAMGDSGGLGGLGARGGGVGGGGSGLVIGGLSDSVGNGSGRGMGGVRRKAGVIDFNRVTVVSEPESNSEGYQNYGVNGFTEAAQDRLSTFSIDVDTASYAISRRKIMEGMKPPADSVRVEEFVNYFKYDYAAPKDGPLTVHMDAAPSPFQKNRTFLRVGVQGKTLSVNERKPAHLTFLVDVSGSMESPDKLPLAKKALRVLVDNLRDGDTVALVTYAGAVRDVLAPTGMEHKAKIHAAIEDLTAGGSTAMASGLELAYKHAAAKLGPDSNSRVIILSDGDANVGPTSQQEILKIISKHVREGVTLSVVGFGMGNYKDNLMEQLADKGNGNYFYCDTILQAKRIFQEQLGGTIEVIAKDVKLQVEFDPAIVQRYRLVGYENRDIADKDFRNDKVDAGEVGSGHTVTALYEVELADGALSKPWATVRLRAKLPKGEVAAESVFQLKSERVATTFEGASKDLRFAVAVAAAAEIFRESPWAKEWSLPQVERIARQASDSHSAERSEFISLIHRAQSLYTKVATR